MGWNWNDKERIVALTQKNPYDRFEDGRPKVPDDILERMGKVTTEEAWGVLNSNDYKQQFEGDWFSIHPDQVLVGRAVTCRYIPSRPDLNEMIQEIGEQEGRIGGQNSWAIDTMVPGDVIVVELFGKVVFGTFTGDNLSTAISSNSPGGGMVVDGGMRDYQRVRNVPHFNGFIKGLDPSAIR
ncbi:MAG: RraA family protein, partial [bacterium]|nr:RraA family protein [bacterium]